MGLVLTGELPALLVLAGAESRAVAFSQAPGVGSARGVLALLPV